MEKFDVIVVGGGPAGLAVAYPLAKAGVKVAVIERGNFSGSKNVMGGVLYRQPTEEVFGEFWKEAPVERPVIEQNYWVLTKDAALKGGFRSQRFGIEPYNCFTVFRARFDKWMAEKTLQAGALIITETVVEDVLRKDGRICGVRTGRPEGDLACDVVVAADGVNSLLAKDAGLKPDWKANEAAVAVKEIISLPAEEIEKRFGLNPGEGATIELYGDATSCLMGTAFIYTNRDSLSVGVGAVCSDLLEANISPNDMLEHLKAHPAVAPLIAGGEVREYLAHLIPEGGFDKMPPLYTDGMVVVGDAAGMVNSLHREGSNLATTSGKCAAEAILRALEWKDFSAKSLARYEQLLRDSYVLRDMEKYRRAPRFFETHPELFTLYPEIGQYAGEVFLSVDGVSKKQKQWQIIRHVLGRRPIWKLASDAWAAWRGLY
ncbi:MAG: FAD-dependent oxidoreductase [Armatimonadetes bacterium]|nr:FAD-dependent oxidoreductase [Armatimonadota bacterium]NIO74913.1 FAD-dependent oxidoreductase [Armatimonadota bacterium]NIO96614.1 FAD-dependent oxidoreductase [Armatimonadota bacterium]